MAEHELEEWLTDRPAIARTLARTPRLLTDGTHKFVWGAQGLVYNLTLGASPTVETYHADQIGSIREITNSDGSVHTTYLTDEYGNRVTTQGTDDQPFQFTGEQVDPETGFVFLRARYYEPQTGRFVTRDPWAGERSLPESLNRYAYTQNNPINYADHVGLGPWEDLKNCFELDSPLFCIFNRLQPGPAGSIILNADPLKNINPLASDESVAPRTAEGDSVSIFRRSLEPNSRIFRRLVDSGRL